MKDHVEIGHLTKYDAFDAFRITKTKLWTLKYGSKSIQASFNFETASPKII